MKIKVALHAVDRGWNPQWITYCQKNNIDYKVFNFYDTDIITQLKEENITHLLWHFHQNNFRDKIMAHSLLYSVHHLGIKSYPNFETCWHFDDKLSQKYLFESIGAPLAPTYVFYNKIDALKFLQEIQYPIVFKLRGGASSMNVQLIKSKKEGKRLIHKAFSKGFSPYSSIKSLKNSYQKFSIGKLNLWKLIKAHKILFVKPTFSKLSSREKGYVLLQKYIENDGYDIRIEMAGDICWGERRGVRKNDFRASGSGHYYPNPELIPMNIVKLAFDLKNELNLQSIAFDFVLDKDKNPYLIEMSYGFGFIEGEGEFYWDKNLTLHKYKINAANLIIENLLYEQIKKL